MTYTRLNEYIKIGANGMKKVDNKKKEVTEREIDIIPILKELLKKLWLIVLVGAVVGGAAFAGAKLFIKPTYRSGFTAYVNNRQAKSKENTDLLTSSDLSASKQLVVTYQKILTSNTILTAAAKSMDFDASYATLKGYVSTESRDETEIIAVYVEHKDPQFAYKYAQAILKTAPQYIAQIVEGSSMKVIDTPEFSDQRYKPNYSRFALIGFLVGALIIIAIVIIRYFIDDTVKGENDLESRFSIPILGVIPDVLKASDNHSDYYHYADNNPENTSEVNAESNNNSKGEQNNEEKQK